MAQIKLEAKTRLVASSQVTAARGEEWWKGLSPKDKAEYLKQHPTSKFKTLTEKQKKLDINKNGKIDSDDLKKVREGETAEMQKGNGKGSK